MFKCGQISNKFIQKTFQATLSINFCKIFARYWIPFISRPSLTNGNMTLVWFPQKKRHKKMHLVTGHGQQHRQMGTGSKVHVHIHGVGKKKNTQTNTSCAPSCEYSCVELLSGPYLFIPLSVPQCLTGL